MGQGKTEELALLRSPENSSVVAEEKVENTESHAGRWLGLVVGSVGKFSSESFCSLNRIERKVSVRMGEELLRFEERREITKGVGAGTEDK